MKTARDLLEKLEQETADFHNSNNLSERHALNAVWSAYHMHEWVWAGLVKSNIPIQQALGLWQSGRRAEKSDFVAHLDRTFAAFRDAQALTNAAKHFIRSGDSSGKHCGAFSADFSPDFDISHLWISRENGKHQRAEDFLEELVEFWRSFLDCYWPI